MKQIIKVRFLKEGIATGKAYVYFSPVPVKPGDTVQINSAAKGVAVEVDVPEEEIAAYRDKVKCIVGLVESKKFPKPIEEISDEEELCQYCDWQKGEIPHRCDSVCEGAYCEEAYEAYLEEFEEENADE